MEIDWFSTFLYFALKYSIIKYKTRSVFFNLMEKNTLKNWNIFESIENYKFINTNIKHTVHQKDFEENV
jgi:hypothetical protein